MDKEYDNKKGSGPNEELSFDKLVAHIKESHVLDDNAGDDSFEKPSVFINDGAIRHWDPNLTKIDGYGMMFSIYFKVLKALIKFYIAMGILSIPVMFLFSGGQMY